MEYTQRVFWTQYNSQKKLNRLLDFLDKHRKVCGRISFFTEGDGTDFRYVPIEQVNQRVVFMRAAIDQARQAGFVPDINILNTLGHSDDIDIKSDSAPAVPWQRMVDDRGQEAWQASCPANTDFQNYVYAKYKAYAGCQADRYWIDDDFRLNSHAPARWGCFCQSCMDDFARRTDHHWASRSDLIQALRSDLSLRKAWISRNHEVMSTLLDQCVSGLRSVDPRGNSDVPIGIMTCNPVSLQDSCPSLQKWMEQLRGTPKIRAWQRPGGGYFNDCRHDQLLAKLYRVSYAIDQAGPDVGNTYEVENYPYARGDKASHSTGLEGLLAIASSKLDGIFFDVLGLCNDPKYHAPWIEKLEQWRPLWDQSYQLVKKTLPVGWRSAYSHKHFEHVPVEITEDIFHAVSPDYLPPLALQRAGLPMTGFEHEAMGNLLCGSAALGMNVKELEVLLEKPLILDGPAAQRYIEVGLGDHIGILETTSHTAGVFEQFTNDPMSGDDAGYCRAANLPYYNLTSYALTPQENTRVLGDLRMSRDDRIVGASMTLYEKGPMPVAVLGHMPWDVVLSQPRIDQLRRLSMHMFSGEIPLVVEGGESVAFWWRRGVHTKQSIAIFFNAGFDSTKLTLKSDRHDLSKASMVMSVGDVQYKQNNSRIDLHLAAWSVSMIDLST